MSFCHPPIGYAGRNISRYAFHHRLKETLTPASPDFKATSLRPHATQQEEWREQQGTNTFAQLIMHDDIL